MLLGVLPRTRFAPLLAALLLALCGLPLPWSFLTPLPLAWLLYSVASAPNPKRLGLRLWAAMSLYFLVQLWWLVGFMHGLMLEGMPPSPLVWVLALLAMLPLMLLEGAFFGLMGYLVGRVMPASGRVWALSGGWVLVEYLRGLGALAFPWAGVGYTLLPTPLVQTADLGGALLLSVLVLGLAAAIATFQQDKRPLYAAAACWLLALGYGFTRPAAVAPDKSALLLRTDYDSFSKAAGSIQGLWNEQLRLSTPQPHEVVVWSETALFYPQLMNTLPDGIYGLSQGGKNTAVGLAGGQITGSYTKAHPVPFGEYFPLAEGPLKPVYDAIFRAIGFGFQQQYPAAQLPVIPLNNVLYGVYICYDSIFGNVTRTLAQNGAQVLVNISNDGWYTGWGVQQHFDMGRVRAIETRRWLLRSVNKGIAAAVNERGEVQRSLNTGQGALHVQYATMSTQTLYTRLGDWPALLLAAGLVGMGLRGKEATKTKDV